jgi:hypothetical protein
MLYSAKIVTDTIGDDPDSDEQQYIKVGVFDPENDFEHNILVGVANYGEYTNIVLTRDQVRKLQELLDNALVIDTAHNIGVEDGKRETDAAA